MLEMVKHKPEVWQVEHKLYHDRKAKAAAFHEMGSHLDVSGAEVKRKLHNLRCTYRRLVRNPTQKKNAKGNADLIRWKFYAPIQFLYVNTRYAGTGGGSHGVVVSALFLLRNHTHVSIILYILIYLFSEI